VRVIVSNATRVFDPGVYVGGIEFRNNSIGIFRPGVYVIQGGGLDVGAQAQIYTVRAGLSASSQATWATDCPATTCGVMFYNVATAGVMGQINVTAGAVVQLRGYNPEVDPGPAGTVHNDWRGMLIWQDRLPVPTATTIQAPIQLNGGGLVYMEGTVYAPAAAVRLSGTSGGGGNFAYPIQFVCWDLSFSGTSTWIFQYNDSSFVRPPDYGLVE
jgi:hypothetical protein